MVNYDFTVLLDKGERSIDGFFSEYELRGVPMYKEGKSGLADSVQAVQEAGLLQVPTYLLVNGRIHADKASEEITKTVWTTWNNSLGERLTLAVEQDRYKDVQKGVYVVDIQNGGFFMPCHKDIRTAVTAEKLKNGAYPVSTTDKDLLFGSNRVWNFDGEKVYLDPLQLFLSYDAFLDASGDPHFLESMPKYAVLRPVEEARKNLSGYRSITEQLENPDLVIPAGGKAPLRNMLLNAEGIPRFKWTQFGSWHDGYKNIDSGHGIVVGSSKTGMFCNLNINIGSRSVGVSPNALNVRNSIFQDLEQRIRSRNI